MSEGDATEGTPAKPGDEATPGALGTGETLCRACRGTGTLEARTCPECRGTGIVTGGIGGG